MMSFSNPFFSGPRFRAFVLFLGLVWAAFVYAKPAPVSNEISMRLDFDWGVDPLPLGDAAAISTSYSFYPKDRTKSYAVRFEQTITPETGLQLQPSLDGTVIPLPSGVNKVMKSQGQQIVTTQEGDYDLVTTATVVETGQSVTAKTHIHVAPAGSPDLSMTVPTLKGDSALPPDIVVNVDGWIEAVGKDAYEVQGVTLKEKRTGQQWTFQKGKALFVYSVMVTLDTHGMVPDDCFTFQATVHTTKGDALSRESKLCVTGLPLKFTHVTIEEIDAGFTTPDGGTVAKDLFSVRFKPDVPETRIREIIAAYGGVIIGAWPEDKEVQVRLVPPPASLQELVGIMHRLSEQPEVLWMDLTYYVDGLHSVSDDSLSDVLRRWLAFFTNIGFR